MHVLLRWSPVGFAVLFAIAHTQPSLYYSNQNQYCLHGAAAAGVGDLPSDWLATTADPTPAFTAFVSLSLQYLGTWPLHAAFFSLLVIYYLSLWDLLRRLPFFPTTYAGEWVLAAGCITLHAGIVRAVSVMLIGFDYPWFAQAGVANQYLLGAGLQPSVFGVFLLTALAAAGRRRPILAGLFAVLACVMHSTYLLPAGLLVLGVVIREWPMDRRQAILTGVVALVTVAPVVGFVVVRFGPIDSATFAEAQRILAWVRIPHHTDVNRWLDPIAGVQIAIAGFGVVAFRKTLAFAPLLSLLVGGIALSLVQIATHDATLALAFPWRVSAVLVPIGSAIGLVACARWAERTLPTTSLGAIAMFIAIAAAAGAGVVYHFDLAYQGSRSEDGLQHYVAANRRPGDLYLLPAGYPKPPAARGSASASFVPVPQTGRPAVFELQRFRLATGAACYVDFKSVPYRDTDVLEWKRRVDHCVTWYATPEWDARAIAQVEADRITHVVVPAGVSIRSSRFVMCYRDDAYTVYRLRAE